MGALGLLSAAVALVLIGFGIVLGAIAAAVTVALILAGVLSSSVAVGLVRGKARAGFYAFVVQFSIAAGVPAGMLCAWIASVVYAAAEPGLLRVLLAGAIGGAFSGLAVALLFVFVAQRLGKWAGARMELPSPAANAVLPESRK
jgi:hypothetical protein